MPKQPKLFLARWPDGTATLLSARSAEHAADLLDEIDDPGGCELAPYNGPVCVHMEPTSKPGELSLDFTSGGFEEDDAHAALLAAAFPFLHKATTASREQRGESPTAKEWTRALADERARPLNPSEGWTKAVAAWWESFSGTRGDQSAALRETLGVSIPGEPKPETPQQRAMFDAEKVRMVKRLDAVVSKPKPAARRPSAKTRKRR